MTQVFLRRCSILYELHTLCKRGAAMPIAEECIVRLCTFVRGDLEGCYNFVKFHVKLC
jgi:hypothetical protein